MDETLRKYHQVAQIFPLMQGQEFEDLKSDIKANGLHEAIWLDQEEAIIDGRNRHRACIEVGVSPSFRTFTGGDLISFVVSLNLVRRHLSSSQRAAISLDVEAMIAEGAKNQQGRRFDLEEKSPNLFQTFEKSEPIHAAEQAADIMGTNRQYIVDAKMIQREAPELLDKVRAGEITIPQAKREIQGVKAREAQEERRSMPIPEGKYKVIYADPPWPVGSIVMDKWKSPLEDKYPTMPLDEIAALPVVDMAADDCSLFLWTTHTFLPDALEIIKAWGFKYFCCITWDKGNGWTQFGFHKKTELLLYAYKGHLNVDPYGDAIPTLISEAKTYHSKKPDSIRELIAGKTPGPRLEMFARNIFTGWTAWGNENELQDGSNVAN